MSATWVFGSQLLFVANQVWRDERLRCQAPQRARSGERPAQEAAGRVDAGDRSQPGSHPKKVVTAPARREVVRYFQSRGVSERRALAVVCMSPRALRYAPAPDRNHELRTQILELPHRH